MGKELNDQEKALVRQCGKNILFELDVLRKIDPTVPFAVLVVIIEHEIGITPEGPDNAVG